MQRAMGKIRLLQQRQDHRQADAIVRPQRGAAIGDQPLAVLHHVDRGKLGSHLTGHHHIHMRLQDHGGSIGRGVVRGDLGHQIAGRIAAQIAGVGTKLTLEVQAELLFPRAGVGNSADLTEFLKDVL